MITALLIILIMTLAFQPTAQRLFAGIVFVGVTLIHEFFLSHLDGELYYGSAALFDLLIIALTSGIHPVPRMVIDIQRLCLVFIAVNFTGWVTWMIYLPPDIYNNLSAIALMWAIWILIRRDRADVGGYSVDSWNSCFRFDHLARRIRITSHGGKI